MELQKTSYEVWDSKHRLKDKNGKPIDKTLDDSFKRIAKTLSSVEINKQEYYDDFLWALRNGCIPAGRPFANLGADKYKHSVSTINCTASGPIFDSMDSIFNRLHESAMTLRAGCGIGYEFSTLRPEGSFIQGVGAKTSGPISFAKVYDQMCSIISSAGARRGAQMMTFNVSHPDILKIINAKREAGVLRKFNISILITDEFMEAVKDDNMWRLYFPYTKKEFETEGNLIDKSIWAEWPVHEDNYVIQDGKVACKIYDIIPARDIWNAISTGNYLYSEPGVIFIDRMNKNNNLYFCENIRQVNPCSEQPLPYFGSCLLGSINLTKFVNEPFISPTFDWNKYKKAIKIFTRMLDNIVDFNGLPLKKQIDEIILKRRHGLGFFGLGSLLCMMKIVYGSEESIKFTEKISKVLAEESYKEGIRLAKEKGPAPIFKIVPDCKELFVKSKYFKNFSKKILEDIKKYGCRFTHATSIAPTGSLALGIGNNTSNGIEPSFMAMYNRNITKEGKNTREQHKVYSFELLKYKEVFNISDDELEQINLPDYFIGANEVKPKEHIDIQSVAQKWIDSAISKTVNVPTETTEEDFSQLYMYAYEKELKSIAMYRYNPKEGVGTILVNPEEQKNTKVTFTLDDGSIVTCAGDEEIMYNGEIHIAALLAEAIREKQYGKF